MTQLPAHLTVENTVEAGLRVLIFLDGEEVEDCVEAHTEEGWLIRAKKNAAGNIYVENDEIVTERLTGVVTAVVE